MAITDFEWSAPLSFRREKFRLDHNGIRTHINPRTIVFPRKNIFQTGHAAFDESASRRDKKIFFVKFYQNEVIYTVICGRK
jgi:hypothetical protein